MHRYKIVGLVLLAVVALSAFASATSLAAVPVAKTLSGEVFPATFTGTSGKGELVTLAKTTVTCEKGKSSGELKGTTGESTEGTAKLTFEGCKSSGFACNTVKEASGVIVTSGTTKVVWDPKKGNHALLLKVTETKFECTSLVKVTVKGNILLLIKPEKETEPCTKNFELVVTQTGGDPTDKTYTETEAQEKEPKSALLLSSINGGTFESSGDTSKENKIVTSKMLEVV
jgi:hypothetical protein